MQNELIVDELFLEYKTFFNKIKGDNSFYRLGKIFKTYNQYYIYDVGTGKVFSINKDIYMVLECLFDTNEFDSLFNLDLDIDSLKSALEKIKECILKENILLAPAVTCFSGPHSLALEDYLEKNMSQLTLEVTERCNLRCKYCIYQDDHNDFHTFSERDITFDIAKKAIDFTYERTDDKFYIAFYGGEPLLNFDIIKQSVEYAEQLVNDKRLEFSMTTNAVLITEDIARYLAEHKFNVMVSLDGPEEIHNENRIFKDGTGSFKYAIRGLKFLLDAYKDKPEESLSISMVTTGPNYKEKYEKIQVFFDKTKWLPKLTVIPSYASNGRFSSDYVLPNMKDDKLYINKGMDPIMEWSIEKQNSRYNKKSLFSNGQITQNLHVIHRRDLTEEPMKGYYFNGCCVPGSRRLHVNVKGEFLPCERVGTVPALGNVDSGFNIKNIKKYYVDDFMNEAVKYCKNCWAIHLCTSCYAECFDNDKVNLSYRHKGCEYVRHRLEQGLILYHEILENDPESLRELNDVELD
ncbi:TPA: radical SAM protein [Clostridioides difficile]